MINPHCKLDLGTRFRAAVAGACATRLGVSLSCAGAMFIAVSIVIAPPTQIAKTTSTLAGGWAPPRADALGANVPDLKQLRLQLEVAVGTAQEAEITKVVADIARLQSERATDLLIEFCLQSPHILHAVVIDKLSQCDDVRLMNQWCREAQRERQPLRRLIYAEVLLAAYLSRPTTAPEDAGANPPPGGDDPTGDDPTSNDPKSADPASSDAARQETRRQKLRETLREVLWDATPFIPLTLLDTMAQRRIGATLDLLVDALEHAPRKRNSDISDRIIDTLQQLTELSMSTPEDWAKWWKAASRNYSFPKPGVSHGTVVIERIRKRGLSNIIDELKESDILVVPGRFDQIHVRLADMRIPYTIVERKTILRHRIDPRQVLIFNCDAKENGGLGPRALAVVRDFVQRGGYLFTSDWELQNVLLGSFPKEFRAGPLTVKEPFWTPIEPDPLHLAHPYLRDMFPANPLERRPLRWKIDPKSMIIHLRPSPSVIPLVRAQELEERWGSGVVAAHVKFGEGSILHVLGHLRDQGVEDGDAEALQQLLVNFIVEKMQINRQAAPPPDPDKKQ